MSSVPDMLILCVIFKLAILFIVSFNIEESLLNPRKAVSNADKELNIVEPKSETELDIPEKSDPCPASIDDKELDMDLRSLDVSSFAPNCEVAGAICPAGPTGPPFAK